MLVQEDDLFGLFSINHGEEEEEKGVGLVLL